MTTLEVIKAMAEYYGKEMSAGQVRMYNDTLDDLQPEQLELAVKEIIKTGKPFMPKVTEIRAAAKKIEHAIRFAVDPLKMIPGAAQSEADLDDRYGTVEHHQELCRLFEAGKYAEADKLMESYV